jgi:DNA polymerase-1
MIAQGTLMPDYPKGLDFIASIWTTHPYYKAEGKKYFSGGNWPRLWAYNATDSLICAEAFPKQIEELTKQQNLPTYERQRKLIEPLAYMMEWGIKVDTVGLVEEATRMKNEADQVQIELNTLVGHELNANSPKQLKEYFYITKGLKPYKKRGTGGITVDDNALKRIIRLGHPEARLVQRIRKLKKVSSTYLDLRKIDLDGRIRCSFNPVGTRYSRLSSSKSIFGTGMNLQNWPHSILGYLVADDGYVYYSYDLAQAENRIVAYLGRDTAMIEAFEMGADVHNLTAALIFSKLVSEVSDEEGSCLLGDGTHSERFWGKKSNHGLNYDLGYKTFAFYYEIPERDAKFIVDRYHSAYPGVRQQFHAYVRRQLAESRTLVNLMGRRTKFLGKMEDAMYKEAYACIPQGTVGDIINERGLEYVYYDQEQFGPLELLVQVHDSLGFQIPLSVPLEQHASMLLAIKKSLEQPLTFAGQTFVIPADLVMGYNFSKADCKEIKWKNFPKTVSELTPLLKKNLEALDGPKA